MNRLKLLGLGLCLCLAAPPAWAVEKDDDVKDDTDEHIAYEASSTKASDDIAAKYPEDAEKIRAAIADHVKHALDRDVEAYIGDFHAPRLRYPKMQREYAERAMALEQLKIEIHAIEFAALTNSSATVHTRQVSSYIDDSGEKRVDDAIISYRWIKVGEAWKISFTERRRLTADK